MSNGPKHKEIKRNEKLVVVGFNGERLEEEDGFLSRIWEFQRPRTDVYTLDRFYKEISVTPL